MKYGIKVIGTTKGIACGDKAIQTERGWENWLGTDNWFGGDGIMSFACLNDAFIKMQTRGGNETTWHTVVDEVKQ